MGPLEQVGPEWPPLSILPKVSGGNGGGEPRGSPKVRVEGLGYGGWDVVISNLFILISVHRVTIDIINIIRSLQS